MFLPLFAFLQMPTVCWILVAFIYFAAKVLEGPCSRLKWFFPSIDVVECVFNVAKKCLWFDRRARISFQWIPYHTLKAEIATVSPSSSSAQLYYESCSLSFKSLGLLVVYGAVDGAGLGLGQGHSCNEKYFYDLLFSETYILLLLVLHLLWMTIGKRDKTLSFVFPNWSL